MSLLALIRDVGPALGECELTHLDRAPIDPALAARQHQAYRTALERLGCRIRVVPPAPGHPDAVFVEDAAVILDEVAVATRPGARSRRGEVAGVAVVASEYRPLRRIERPGTVDGGDVLRVGRTIFVGASERTNAEGFRQLRAILEPAGYELRRVDVDGCLHLKTAVTAVSGDTLLLNPDWVDGAALAGYDLVEVDPAEPFGANVLRIGAVLLMAAAHPRTRRRLEARGLRVETVDVSELAKAEGGVTCCSILLTEHPEEER